MREYLFVIIIAAVLTYASTPLLRTIAVRAGAYTQVRSYGLDAQTPQLHALEHGAQAGAGGVKSSLGALTLTVIELTR